MVRSCCVNRCTNVRNPNQNIQYYKFPLKNPVLLEKWIKACRFKNFTPTVHTLICSLHFKKEDYSVLAARKKRLKFNVVPSVFNFPVNQENKIVHRKLKRTQDFEVKTEMMESTEDSPESITMEHAYAAQNNTVAPVKIENNDTEMLDWKCIKLEDISIKSEIHDDDIDLSFQYQVDTSHIKKEDSLDTAEQTEEDILRHNASLKEELEIAKQKIAKLTEENNLFIAENGLLKLEVQKYLELKSETFELKETIKSNEEELLAFEDLKRYHQQIENQIEKMKFKFSDFGENVIPSMKNNHSKEVQQLKHIIESKDKSLSNLKEEVERLIIYINSVKKKLTAVIETNKDNYNKQSDLAKDYEGKLKVALENQIVTQKFLEHEKSQLSDKKQELNNLIGTYTKLLASYGNCIQHNEKLKTDFDDLKKRFYKMIETNRQLSEELKKANNKISELSQCKYCGL